MAVITLSTQPPIDPKTPTPTYYQGLSAEIQAAVDTLAGLLPKLDESLSADERQIRRNLNVPDVYCYSAINAVQQHPELNAGNALDVDQCLNDLQFIEAFRPVFDKFFTVSRRLRHALRMKKSLVGTATLQVLRNAKAQRSNGRNPAVSALVETLQRDLGRKTGTKAEREQRKAEKFAAAVEEAVAARMKEVQLTAA
jgi:hypothetical protein